MTKHIRLTNKALADIVDVATYIASDNPEASDRFLAAVEDSFTFLQSTPGVGTIRSFGNRTLGEVRMWPLPRFRRYLIFYRESSGSIEIIRVLHGARDLPSIFEDEVGE